MADESDKIADTGGAQGHFRALERLYAEAPINRLFDSRLEIGEAGTSKIFFDVDERYYHAAAQIRSGDRGRPLGERQAAGICRRCAAGRQRGRGNSAWHRNVHALAYPSGIAAGLQDG